MIHFKNWLLYKHFFLQRVGHRRYLTEFPGSFSSTLKYLQNCLWPFAYAPVPIIVNHYNRDHTTIIRNMLMLLQLDLTYCYMWIVWSAVSHMLRLRRIISNLQCRRCHTPFWLESRWSSAPLYVFFSSRACFALHVSSLHILAVLFKISSL